MLSVAVQTASDGGPGLGALIVLAVIIWFAMGCPMPGGRDE